MNIPFCTFKYMNNQIKDELDKAYQTVLERGIYIQGEECRNFEKEYAEYCGTKYCVGVGNGLDALYLSLKAMNIGEGDEVIVPSNTYIATALAVSYTGAVPILSEPQLATYNLDPQKIEKKITSKTKAIIAVHLQGRAADIDAITEIANKYGLRLIEDAAQAHGTRYKRKRVGGLAEIAGFSFYPGKNLGAIGDGGCITTNNKALAEKVRALGNYGSDYKYHHIYKGVNSRLDELQAAFLRVKLKKLDEWNQERQVIAEKYFNNISNPHIVLPLRSSCEYEHIYHVFAIRCDQRDRLEKYLNENGIGTVKHYPVPIHMQKAYEDAKIREGDLPISEEISRTELSIPMYYGMREDEADYICEKINQFR